MRISVSCELAHCSSDCWSSICILSSGSISTSPYPLWHQDNIPSFSIAFRYSSLRGTDGGSIIFLNDRKTAWITALLGIVYQIVRHRQDNMVEMLYNEQMLNKLRGI